MQAQVVEAFRLQGHTDGISQLAITPNGHTLATASLDSSLRMWQIQDQQKLKVGASFFR